MRELKAEQITRALLYIDKVAGIDIPDHLFTDRLKALGKVRNCLAHADGRLEDFNEPDTIKKIVKDMEGLSVSDDGYVDFEKGTCYSLIREAHEWVEYVLVSTGLDSKK